MAYSYSDLAEILKHKLNLLLELQRLVTKQIAVVDFSTLGPLIEEKDQLLDEMRKVDQLESDWKQHYPQKLHGLEQKLQEEIQKKLTTVLDLERGFEARLAHEQKQVHQELKALSMRSRVKGYLDQKASRGVLLNRKH